MNYGCIICSNILVKGLQIKYLIEISSSSFSSPLLFQVCITVMVLLSFINHHIYIFNLYKLPCDNNMKIITEQKKFRGYNREI